MTEFPPAGTTSSAEVVEDASVFRGSATDALDPVQRQSLCRVINDEISQRARLALFDAAIDLVCECRRPGCFELIRVSPGMYETVRRRGGRFVVKAGHIDGDRAVHETEEFLIIEAIGATEDAATHGGLRLGRHANGVRRYRWLRSA